MCMCGAVADFCLIVSVVRHGSNGKMALCHLSFDSVLVHLAYEKVNSVKK